MVQSITVYFFKQLDCVHDICFSFTYRVMGFCQMTVDLKKETSRIGLKINTIKIKILSLRDLRILPGGINGQNIESVNLYIYTLFSYTYPLLMSTYNAHHFLQPYLLRQANVKDHGLAI